MNNRKYFKVVGEIELFFSIAGIIFGFVLMISISVEAGWALKILGSMNGTGYSAPLVGWALAWSWIFFILGSFLAPALGLLFIAVGEMLERNAKADSEIQELKAKLSKCESNNEESEPKEQTVKSSEEKGNNPAEQAIIKEKAVNKPSKKKGDNLVVGKDKNNYEINDHICFKEDCEFNDLIIKKGSTGVIDNRLLSYGGTRYMVILDDTKETVQVSGEYFE